MFCLQKFGITFSKNIRCLSLLRIVARSLVQWSKTPLWCLVLVVLWSETPLWWSVPSVWCLMTLLHDQCYWSNVQCLHSSDRCWWFDGKRCLIGDQCWWFKGKRHCIVTGFGGLATEDTILSTSVGGLVTGDTALIVIVGTPIPEATALTRTVPAGMAGMFRTGAWDGTEMCLFRTGLNTGLYRVVPAYRGKNRIPAENFISDRNGKKKKDLILIISLLSE